MSNQLLQFTSPAEILSVASDTSTRFVKGFASVQRVDRQGDFIAPEDFQVARFLAGSAPVLVNHKHWVDDRGNFVAAGNITEAYPAQVVDIGKADVWGVHEISGSRTNQYPKSSIPDLVPGDKGLFVVAEISQPEIVAKVDAGKLRGFSWKGITRVEKKIVGGQIVKRLYDVDLMEVSLVDVPVNPYSTFVVGKSFTESEIYTIILEKSFFDREGATNFLSSHGFISDDLIEGTDSFLSYQLMGTPPARLFSVRLSPGVRAVVGDTESSKSTETAPIAAPAEKEGNLSVSGEEPMSDSAVSGAAVVTLSPEQVLDELKKAHAASEASYAEQFSKVEASVSELRAGFETKLDAIQTTILELLSVKNAPQESSTSAESKNDPEEAPAETSEEAPAEEAPAEEAPAEAPQTLEGSLDAMLETSEAAKGCNSCASEPVNVTSIPGEEIFASLFQSLKAIADAVDSISQKQAAQEVLINALKGATPGGTTRSETLKSVTTSDPNSVFDNLFQ